MIYSFAISTPANTAAASPVNTELGLVSGIVHQFDLVFPTGCAALCYVAVRHGLHQLWPTNPTESFHTDGETISFKENYHLPPGESVLTVVTYNLDTVYAHEVHLRIGILKPSDLQGIWLPWTDEDLAALPPAF